MSKYPCLPQGWSLGILRERGVSITEIFKAMQEAKLEIPCRWKGPNQKAILWGGRREVWIFLESQNGLLPLQKYSILQAS